MFIIACTAYILLFTVMLHLQASFGCVLTTLGLCGGYVWGVFFLNWGCVMALFGVSSCSLGVCCGGCVMAQLVMHDGSVGNW